MGKILDGFKTKIEESSKKLAELNWDEVIYDYLEFQGYIKGLEYQILRNLTNSSHVIEIELGQSGYLYDSIGEYIFDNYGTTTSDEEIKTYLEIVCSSNGMNIILSDFGEAKIQLPIWSIIKY